MRSEPLPRGIKGISSGRTRFRKVGEVQRRFGKVGEVQRRFERFEEIEIGEIGIGDIEGVREAAEASKSA